MIKIDASKGNRKDIEESVIINNKSILHQGFLNELNIKDSLRKKIYFRLYPKKDSIYTMYIDSNSKTHILVDITNLKSKPGHKKGLETERIYAPYLVLIDSPRLFFKYEKILCKYPFSQ